MINKKLDKYDKIFLSLLRNDYTNYLKELFFHIMIQLQLD